MAGIVLSRSYKMWCCSWTSELYTGLYLSLGGTFLFIWELLPSFEKCAWWTTTFCSFFTPPEALLSLGFLLGYKQTSLDKQHSHSIMTSLCSTKHRQQSDPSPFPCLQDILWRKQVLFPFSIFTFNTESLGLRSTAGWLATLHRWT